MSSGINFQEKVVLITGASSGIGAATAILLSKYGASLALVGQNKDNLSKIANLCQSKSLQIIANLTNESDVEKVIEETISFYGKLDVLECSFTASKNCNLDCKLTAVIFSLGHPVRAGILEIGSIETTTLAQYDNVMNVNVRSVYHLTMLATPYLIESKGCIVNVSSVNGIRSFPGVLAYCMSKAAIDQFTRCTALELAPKQVRVNSVNPGVIQTDIHKRGGMDETAYQQFLEKCKTTHALGRHGVPDEVAHVIAFLASSEASFITGASIPIDGGRHAMCPR